MMWKNVAIAVGLLTGLFIIEDRYAKMSYVEVVRADFAEEIALVSFNYAQLKLERIQRTLADLIVKYGPACDKVPAIAREEIRERCFDLRLEENKLKRELEEKK